MSELLNKISTYNIFNYLFPGAVFSILADRLYLIDSPEDIVRQLLWYYFVGMVISRVGSVMLEPVLRRIRFVRYSDYSNYLRACVSDPKLELMVEVSNTYRTLAAAFALLSIGIFFHRFAEAIDIPTSWMDALSIIL
ncbi:MAG TPA: hypothetical protein VIL60_05320, partial [Rhodanobacter sp.]